MLKRLCRCNCLSPLYNSIDVKSPNNVYPKFVLLKLTTSAIMNMENVMVTRKYENEARLGVV